MQKGEPTERERRGHCSAGIINDGKEQIKVARCRKKRRVLGLPVRHGGGGSVKKKDGDDKKGSARK